MKKLPLVLLILLALLSAFLYRMVRGRPDGLYAEMDTSRGRVVFRLYSEKVPITVANFIALSQGSNRLVEGERTGLPFYDGLTFHKVVPGVMVLGGDPKGTGNGGPGFRFERELRPDLKFDRPGLLAMLNDGAASHGSQFFITLCDTPRYDGKHTIFGEVVQGRSVVEELQVGDTIQSISIAAQGDDASTFDLTVALQELEQSARRAEADTQKSAREKTDRSEGRRKWEDLPALPGKTDPARIPADDQPESEKVALEYLLVSHREAAMPTGRLGVDRSEARQVALRLSRIAREEGADFGELAREFSDSSEYRIPLLLRNGKNAETLQPCFRLKPGQVTDPIDTPKGFMVCRRVPLDLIEVRHILISYGDARGSRQTRTKEAAKSLAETLLRRARSGENFSELAREYSDSDSADRGGRIGEIARGMTVPAFDHAAFGLKVGEISSVTLTPAGYQIIKRIK